MKLKILEKPYYKNKKEFMKLYKSLGLFWEEGTKVGDVWRNKDFSSYLRKIPEQNGYKRFMTFNVPEMVKFLRDIGAEEYEDNVDEPVEVKVEPVKPLIIIPDGIEVIVGNNLDICRMSEAFKLKWKMLEIKYANYTVNDLYKEIEEKNRLRRIELGIKEDVHENEEVSVKKKESDEILPEKDLKKKTVRKKSSKQKKVREVVVETKQPVEYKKKVFKILKK